MNSAESQGSKVNGMGTDFEPTQPDRKGYVVKAIMLSLYCVVSLSVVPLLLGDSSRRSPLDTLFYVLNYVVNVPLALIAIPRCLHGLRVPPYIRLTRTGIHLKLWRATAVDYLLPFRRPVEIEIPWEEFVDCRARVESGNPLTSSYVIVQHRRRRRRSDDEIRIYESLFQTSASGLMTAILNYAALHAPATAQRQHSATATEPPPTIRAGWGEGDLGSAPADLPSAAPDRTADPERELPEPVEVRVPVNKAWLPLLLTGVVLMSLGLGSSLIYGFGSVACVVACLPIAIIGGFFILIGYEMVKTRWENRKRCRLQLRADGLVVKSSSGEETVYPWSEIALTRIIRTEEQSVFKRISSRWQLVFRGGGTLEIPDIYNRSLEELQDLLPRYSAIH
jgi:hypothetical protein